MNSLVLEGLIDIYIRNLIPNNQKETALLDMAALIRSKVMIQVKKEYIESNTNEEGQASIPSDFDWLSEESFKKDVDRRTKTSSLKYYEMLSTIMEMLDKGDCGFLTGDLTPKLIVWMQKIVSQLIANLEFVSLDLSLTTKKRDMIITNFYQEIFKTVSENLFKLPSNGIPFPDSENPRNLFERQLILEDESSDISVERFTNMYQTMQDLNMTHKLKVSTNPMVSWLPPLCKLIKDEQIKCTEPDLAGDRANYGPFLLKLSPEKLSIIALTELMKLIMKISTMKDEDSYSTNGYFIINKILFQNIGKAVSMQMQLESEEHSINLRIKEELKAKLAEGKPGAQIFLNRKAQMLKAQAAENIFKGKLKERVDVMNKTVQIQLGSLLSYMMICSLKTRNSQGDSINLLSTGYIRADSNPNSKKKIGITRIEEYFIHNLVEFIEKKDSMLIHLDRSLPMIYKPANWIDPRIGGYFQRPTSFVRQTESPAFERAVRFSDMSKMFNVLDLLGSVPWRINRKVLNVVEELWSLGGGVGEIPTRYYDYKDYTYEYQVKECTDNSERRRLLKQIQLQRDVHGLRCDFNLKLDQARAFAKVSKIYYPHNVDFRGRVYPIPPHLNHMSSDICRGLLEFGEGKPLGKTGLRWLKIHLANKMGRDKLSMEARHDYGDSVLPLVEKVVNDPIKNREWLEHEDCWQVLAAMFELHAAVGSSNPEEFISHLHIHQDGSCNGLQHYAALGRDYDGGFQVNLVNREIPGDLYTHIAQMVEKKILEDLKEGVIDQLELAKKLSGNVKRKIIKQTVMTTVYGVTFIGARKQIEKQLRDKDFLDHSDDKESYAASVYLAKTTLDCVANLFSQAHAIKQWLKDCSKIISLYGQPMSWVTPLGLPVIQPYRSVLGSDTIETILQKVTVIEDNDTVAYLLTKLPVSKVKQQTAFPPNFIHSLDSTHMMYTCLRCNEEGITFAAVHDSYWTHASSLDRLSALLREEFVRLHSQPLLEELQLSLKLRFPHIEFPELPSKGKLDLNEVKQSRYFFS